MKYLVFDQGGLSLEHAARLGRDGHHIWYYTHYQSAFPKFSDAIIGMGFPNIEKVLYPFDYIDKADAIIFFDIGAGDLAKYLRSKGYVVYGAAEGEKLENHRGLWKKIQQKIALPTQPWVEIKGLDNLRSYLKTHKDKYVKMDIFRGDIESFESKDYNAVELYLNEIGEVLGPFADTYSFIVENKVKGIEPGIDLFFNGKEFLKPYLWGYEHAKSAYIGRFSEQLPPPLEYVADKLTPILQELDYRGAISVEVMVTEKGVPFVIDMCMRFPFPLSAIYTEAIKNYSDVIWACANKQTIRLDVAHKFVCALPFDSSHAEDHWVKILLDEKDRKNIKFRLAAYHKGNYYAVKGLGTVVVLIAEGDSPQQLINTMEKMSEKVDAFALNTDGIGNLPKIHEIIEKSPKYNLPFLRG